MAGSVLDGRRRSRLADLPRRIYLTYRYEGLGGLVRHSLLFPLRLTGLDRALGIGLGPRQRRRGGAPLVPRPRAAGDDRHPQLSGRRARRRRRGRHPSHHALRSRARHRRRRRQRPRAYRGAASHRGHRGGARRDQRRVRGQRQPWAACGGPGARRRPAELRRAAAARLAGLPTARRQRRSAARDRRCQAAVPRQPDPVRRHDPQRPRSGMVRPPLSRQAR